MVGLLLVDGVSFLLLLGAAGLFGLLLDGHGGERRHRTGSKSWSSLLSAHTALGHTRSLTWLADLEAAKRIARLLSRFTSCTLRLPLVGHRGNQLLRVLIKIHLVLLDMVDYLARHNLILTATRVRSSLFK